MKRMKQQQQQQQQESLLEKIHRYRGVLVLVSVPTLLVFFVLFFMPRSPVDTIVSSSSDVLLHRRPFVPGNGGDDDAVSKSYAVIFDAGSSGSRVHVYCFDSNLDLLPIRKDLELFVQTKPGLSAYANDPQKAAESLSSLLDEAVNVVPPELHSTTPVRVGATAGLRALGENVSENILKAVRNFLEEKSSLKTRPDWVTVLDGNQEGAFQWVTINYLLGNLGKKYPNTVGVVDLGGGSVQMAYAISEEDAAKAPSISNGEESYVKELLLKGTKYYLYVHSYLHYGLLAARAEILKAFDDSGNVCSLSGFHGKFKYGGENYDASASTAGPNFDGCKRAAVRALKVDESTCTHMKCTFGGVWNGGGGDGQKNLFVASFFFDRAAEAGFVDPTVPFAKVKPMDFKDAAKRACETSLENAKAIYPRVEENNLPFLCMDLSYQYALLVDGFGLDPWQEIKLVKQVKYRDSLVEAAWPLGSAIEVASSTT